MPEQSLKLVRFSNGKPTPWWRKPSVVSVVITAVVTTLLGAWMYSTRSPEAPADGISPVGNATPDAVQKVLSAGKPTIIEFGANNCVSCREMKPILHALAQDPRIAVTDVDILKERDYIGRYQIRLMPTQVFYDAKGQETSRHMGKISGDEILERLGIAGSTGSTLPKATL